jgi:hypothetical protein
VDRGDPGGVGTDEGDGGVTTVREAAVRGMALDAGGVAG